MPFSFGKSNPLIFSNGEKATLQAEIEICVEATEKGVKEVFQTFPEGFTFAREEIVTAFQPVFEKVIASIASMTKRDAFLQNTDLLKQSIYLLSRKNLGGYLIIDIQIKQFFAHAERALHT